jgi:hypothetical protein
MWPSGSLGVTGAVRAPLARSIGKAFLIPKPMRKTLSIYFEGSLGSGWPPRAVPTPGRSRKFVLSSPT